MKAWLIFIIMILFAQLAHSQVHLQGIIYDSLTHEPLPFVNIAVKGTTQGTSTALSGKFKLDVDQLPCHLLISYVGYVKKEVIIEKSGFLELRLQPSAINLGEAVVIADYDPALELMKKVVKNADKNNPETGGSFQYLSYNKMVFTIGADSILLAEEKIKTTDKEKKKMLDFFEKQHLFMSECISEKKYLDKNHQKEIILSSRVSGFEAPVFSLISTQFQSFHFYLGEISLGDVKYTGPVSQHGLNFYRYQLKDTFYLGKDTLFAISFSPKNEKSQQGMMGVIQIHTDGFAIYNVIAEPFHASEDGFGIKISQQYQKINGVRWFPDEFTTRIIFFGAKVGEYPIEGIGYGKLSEINLNPDLKKKDFDEFEIEISEEKKNENDLNKMRFDSLSAKEKETYRVIDSLGQKHNLTKKMQALQSVFNGYIPVKFIDWDLTKLMNYNEYEGFRLGLALRTNHKISKRGSLGGYIAYGFHDRAWKYGSDLNLQFSKRKQIELNLSVLQDVEASSVITNFEKPRYFLAQGYSSLFMNRYDSVLKYEGRFSFRTLRHFKFSLFGNHQLRNAYDNYHFLVPLNEFISYADPQFVLTETGIELKMLIHEKFIETPFGNLTTGSSWPLVIFRYTRGLKGVFNSEYEYNRYTLSVDYSIRSLRAGSFFLSLKGGKITGDAPYHLHFNPAGTYKPVKKLTVFSMDGFETMRLNEFLATSYSSLHFRYRLPWPLVNGKKFRPLLSFTQAFAIGKTENAQIHQNIYFTPMNNIFAESGIVIDNLLKSGFSGLGIGAFYRWGYYSFPSAKDNFALKISIAFALM